MPIYYDDFWTVRHHFCLLYCKWNFDADADTMTAVSESQYLVCLLMSCNLMHGRCGSSCTIHYDEVLTHHNVCVHDAEISIYQCSLDV